MMPIRLDRENELSVHQQLRQQIIFAIATGEYPVGHALPSVRTLAIRHKINRNTVSRVYAEMVEQRWLVRQKGRRLLVLHPKGPLPDPAGEDIDTLLVRALLAARAQG